MESKAARLLLVNSTERYRDAVMSGDLSLPTDLAHSIESLILLSFEAQEVGILGISSDGVYNQMLGAGFRVIGGGFNAPLPSEAVLKLVVDFCPTHLVLQVPNKTILQWAIKNQIQVIALFTQQTLQAHLEQGWESTRFAHLLNDPGVFWVAGQGMQASNYLQKIGVEPNKIVPWAWPQLMNETTNPAKQLDITERPLELLYTGAMVSTKGVGDLLIAVAQLRNRGLKATLKMVGRGEIDRFQDQVAQLHLEDHVELLETVPEQGFYSLFDQADILVIPSRHEYPETNLNLIDDGLAARIPMVVSNHPLFASRLYHGVNAMIFPAGNARALAHRIERLTSQPQLYEQLSTSAQFGQDDIKNLVLWSDVIEHLLESDDRQFHWLTRHCLASERYLPSSVESAYLQRSA
ncbi:MAG: glycosyltransferase [Cyanobacteria bacterium J06635_1]